MLQISRPARRTETAQIVYLSGMPAGPPSPFPIVLLCLALLFAGPASAGNGTPLDWIGIDSGLEGLLIVALLVIAGAACLHRASRFGNRWLALPALPLLLAAFGIFLMLLYFRPGRFLPWPDREKPAKVIHVKRVIGGWTAWVDTAWIDSDRYTFVSYIGRDSGTVFQLETHLDKVREYPRSFLCFNLYDHSEPQRYSDRADAGIGLEIHRFDGMTGQGVQDMKIPYDFTVTRRDRTYLIEGQVGGIDIGGTYEWKWDQTRVFFPPPGWVRPEGYPGSR